MKKIYPFNPDGTAPRGGASGLYRLMFWYPQKHLYVFPPFSECLRLRMGASILRPHSLNECRKLRADYLLRWPSALLIIVPYPY